MVGPVARAPVHPIMRGETPHTLGSILYTSPNSVPPGGSRRGPAHTGRELATPIAAPAPAPTPVRWNANVGGLPSLPSWQGVSGALGGAGQDLRNFASGAAAAISSGATGAWRNLVALQTTPPGRGTVLPYGPAHFGIAPIIGPNNFPGGPSAYYAFVGAVNVASIAAFPEAAPEEIGGLAAGAGADAASVGSRIGEAAGALSRGEEIPAEVAGAGRSLGADAANLLGRARQGAVDAGTYAWNGAKSLISPAIKVVGGSVLAGLAGYSIYGVLTNVGAGAANLFNPGSPIAPSPNPILPYPGGGGTGGGTGTGDGGSGGTGGTTGSTDPLSNILGSPIILLGILVVGGYLLIRSSGKES